MKESVKINIFHFLWYFFTSINLLEAINQIQTKYQCSAFHFYFGIPGYWKRVQYWEDRKNVSHVMRKYQRQTIIDHNFRNVHGCHLNIHHPNIAYHISTKIKLKDTMPSWETFQALLIQHQNILYSPYLLDYNQNLELFLLQVWKDFLVGETVLINYFEQVYININSYLHQTFHGTKTVFLPGMGESKRWWYQKQINHIKKQLDHMIDISFSTREGWVSSWQNQMSKLEARDNLFHAILVIDFIYSFLFDYLLQKSKDDTYYWEASLQTGYLYPLRFRKDINGNYGIVNLVKSGVYFSDGVGKCIGYPLVHKVIIPWADKLITHIKFHAPDYHYYRFLTDLPQYPELKIRKEITLFHFLSKIPVYHHKNIPEYKHLLKVSEYPYLRDYIIESILSHLPMEVDGITTMEMRGIFLASMIAYHLKLPLYQIRKRGGIPGPVVSSSQEMVYATTHLEIARDTIWKNKKICIIDDGIASGGTTLAAINLIHQLGGEVVYVGVMIRHGKQYTPAYLPYDKITHFVYHLI